MHSNFKKGIGPIKLILYRIPKAYVKSYKEAHL